MQDTKQYNYTIELDKLQETIKEVIETEQTVYIIINGEFYEIKEN